MNIYFLNYNHLKTWNKNVSNVFKCALMFCTFNVWFGGQIVSKIKWGFISIWVHYQGSMTFLNGLHQFYPNFENEVQKFWKLCHFLYKKPCPWNLIVMKFYASFGIGVQLSYIFLIKILCIYKLKFTFKIHEVPL
jgi:hypothetical protein